MKFPGNLGEIFEQARSMQESLTSIKAELETREVVGTAAGENVRVVMTGGMEVRSISIDPSLLATGQSQTIESILVLAFNDALNKAKGMLKGEMDKVTGGIPGF